MGATLARILVVDDESALTQTIKAAFDGNGWEIHTCGDVQTAAGMISEAKSEGWEYDAAILDIRLPRSPEDHETPVDGSLCRLFSGNTLVWHISAHFGEEDVDQHMKACHSSDEHVAMVSKAGGFVRYLERQIKQALATRRIRSVLAMLHTSRGSAYSMRFRPEPDSPSLTNLMAAVCEDIKRSWEDLAQKVRDELTASFDIQTDEAGRVRNVFPR